MIKKSIVIMFVLLPVLGCETIKPYEKEYLVHPLMEDDYSSRLNPQFARACVGRFEHLSAGGPSSQGAQSCPTCGG